MTGRLKSNRKGWEALKRRLMRFDERNIDVGFFKGAKYGPDNQNMYVAEVARMNDYGTSKVPSRPFMTIDFVKFVDRRFHVKARQLFHQLLTQKGSGFQKELDHIGSYFSDSLKTIIYDYPGNNSPWWAAHKGFDDPLYHTGVMVNSVNYRVQKKRIR